MLVNFPATLGSFVGSSRSLFHIRDARRRRSGLHSERRYLVERARCQSHDDLGGICLAGREVEAVEFQEEEANHKPRPLIAIDERMIADNAGSIPSSHFDNVRSLGIGMVPGADAQGLTPESPGHAPRYRRRGAPGADHSLRQYAQNGTGGGPARKSTAEVDRRRG